MDELNRIERQYGSITEYNRCVEEEAGRRWEQTRQAHLRYAENQRQIDEYEKSGYQPIAEAFCNVEQCHFCKNRTKTFYCNEDDDIGVFFCLDNKCENYRDGDEQNVI